LAEHVAMCIECHSGRDAQGNILQDELFFGGPIPFAPPWPNDWAPRAPRNRGRPGYTDEEALRLLTEGAIGRDGKQLRPPMPRFRMTPQDASDVIAFLRSLPCFGRRTMPHIPRLAALLLVVVGLAGFAQSGSRPPSTPVAQP